MLRFEVFLAVTMKNAAFWDIKTQFIPHKTHYVSTTQPSRLILRFEVFTAVTMKNAVFIPISGH
jgi:hypothetical protein